MGDPGRTLLSHFNQSRLELELEMIITNSVPQPKSESIYQSSPVQSSP